MIYVCKIDGFQYSNHASYKWHVDEKHPKVIVEDLCSECGGHLGYGIPAAHLGICEDCEDAQDLSVAAQRLAEEGDSPVPAPEEIGAPEPTESEDLETGGGDFGGAGSSEEF